MQRQSVRNIAAAVTSGVRTGIVLPHTTLRPKITRRNFGPVIVIRRKSNRLFLYDGSRYRRFFAVATGQIAVPDAARALLDRRQVEEPLVVSA